MGFSWRFWYRNWRTKTYIPPSTMDTYPSFDLERCIFASNQLLVLTTVFFAAVAPSPLVDLNQGPATQTLL